MKTEPDENNFYSDSVCLKAQCSYTAVGTECPALKATQIRIIIFYTLYLAAA